ncbi:MAG: glycosyltransferase [Solimicrobium sp.]|jgi:glycosyltransferase involved in cell wall biosynthesis|nr:glycosyltransferase [Solimicrobium sp.]
MTDPLTTSDLFRLTCVVPAYNEAAHLASFVCDLAACLNGITPYFEILIIDDGSTDQTAALIKPILADCSARYLALSRNFGKEAALSAGLDYARGDAVILIDGDYQHPLSLLPEMVALWRSGYDMVFGVIANRDHESMLKRLGTHLLYRLLEGDSRFTIPRNAGDFRLLDRRVVNALKSLPERNRFMKGLYAWVGFKSVALPFIPLDRPSGSSSFDFSALKNLAITGVTAFTTLPLRIWSGIGAAISLTSVIYAAYVAIDTVVIGKTVPGWSTLTVGLMFFSGVQLLSIGILGEYLGRIYDEVKQRPLYLIAEDADNSRIGLKPGEKS